MEFSSQPESLVDFRWLLAVFIVEYEELSPDHNGHHISQLVTCHTSERRRKSEVLTDTLLGST